MPTTTTELREIIYDLTRCGSPATAMSLIARTIGRPFSWLEDLDETEREQALAALNEQYPPKDLSAVITQITKP